MRNGTYKARFWTKQQVGSGVLVLENGVIQGGDSLAAIAGTYDLGTGDLGTGDMRADLRMRRHSEGIATLWGSDKAHLVMTGSWSQDRAQLAGPVMENPDITIKLALELLDI